MAQNYYESFKKKLEEIFMMDHAELDFGIYRIMNQKRSDIQRFLDSELLPQVKQVLESNNADTDKTKKRMAEIAAKLARWVDRSIVRIDLYSICGKIYFSEITFSPSAGLIHFEPVEWDRTVGDWIHLPISKNEA